MNKKTMQVGKIPTTTETTTKLPQLLGVTYASMGVQIDETINDKEFCLLLKYYHDQGKKSTWCLGDVANARKTGKQKKFAKELGINYGTLRNAASVAGRFVLSRRHDKLSFEHHSAVVSIEDKAKQDELLHDAEVNKWPVAKLKEKVKALKGEPVEPKTPSTERMVRALNTCLAGTDWEPEAQDEKLSLLAVMEDLQERLNEIVPTLNANTK